MKKLHCSHEQENPKQACIHLFDKSDLDYCKYFTGKGIEYILLCMKCRSNTDEAPLITLCSKCFDEVENKNFWDGPGGIIGKPEILYSLISLNFEHIIVKPDFLPNVHFKILKPSMMYLAGLSKIFQFEDS